MAGWKAPAPEPRDPAGEREEAAQYAELEDSLRTWAHSWSSAPQEREADQAEPEAGS